MKKSLKFVDYFYGISPRERDILQYNLYFKSMEMYKTKNSFKEVSDILDVHPSTVKSWIRNMNFPFLIRLYKHYINLGKLDKKYQWLPMNSTRGGLLIGPWIKIPNKISSFKDIEYVVNQLNPLKNSRFKNYKKLDMFAYVLGMTVGDTSKLGIERSQRVTRRLQLRLTKRYKSNEITGEFVKFCLNSLGVRMNRTKDCPAGKRNTHPFYAWHSQCSLFIQWIFNVCLGMSNQEKTTYDPINARWILDTPRSFRISFLQGLADSDGWVDITTFRAGIVGGPNTGFIQEIYTSLGINSFKGYLHRGTLGYVSINLNDASKLPLFNPCVKSYRYIWMERIVNAKRFSNRWEWPEWLGKEIDKLVKRNLSSTEIIKKVLEKYNIAISQNGVRRRCQKILSV
ncbi:hypothetical protein J4443_02840 [Candidatus Woesearchaeota archaeon]|nr:hypothetical protein [Candidatus Woesearchaeota archaeon]